MTTSFLTFLVAAVGRVRDLADRSERGATATEYALLVAFIAIAITVGVTAFGTQLNTFFNNLSSTLHLG